MTDLAGIPMTLLNLYFSPRKFDQEFLKLNTRPRQKLTAISVRFSCWFFFVVPKYFNRNFATIKMISGHIFFGYGFRPQVYQFVKLWFSNRGKSKSSHIQGGLWFLSLFRCCRQLVRYTFPCIGGQGIDLFLLTRHPNPLGMRCGPVSRSLARGLQFL